MDQPPVVGKILPAGVANDGVEIVEAACETLINLPPQAAGDRSVDALGAKHV